jgi:hypothetical protein
MYFYIAEIKILNDDQITSSLLATPSGNGKSQQQIF